jgi:hypothetical protein
MKVDHMSKRIQEEIELMSDNENLVVKKSKSNNIHYTIYRLVKFKLNKKYKLSKTKENA